MMKKAPTVKGFCYAARLLSAAVALAALPGLTAPLWGDQAGSGVLLAAEEKSAPKEKARRTQAMNNKTYEKLAAAQTEVEAKNYAAAVEILNGMQKAKKPLNDFELANVLNLYAFIYYSQEKYPEALKAYEKIITLEKAPQGMVIQARFSLAQLYFVTEQWQKAIDALQAWFKVTDKPGANAYVLLAQGYYQLKQYDQSLQHVTKAINMYQAKGKVPKENWFGLQRFLYYEKNDYKNTVKVLKQLITHYPKKQYWLQISGMYGELKQDKKQLSAMETAYVQGMLGKEKELVNLAYLYLANDVPYKAAKVLDKAVKQEQVEKTAKHLELLANAWRASQEVKKAIPVMAAAAEKSDDGELWARLGSIYLDNDEYQKAIDAITAGLYKGGVKRPDSARLVLGMAHFNLKQYSQAEKAFVAAREDERSEDYAKQWLKYLRKEQERQRSLQDV
jgi:tetratricopeptide (TPR) repeat protein